MNSQISNTAEKPIIGHHSKIDIAAFEPILKRHIRLEDAALSNKNKHPLKRLFDIVTALTVLVIASPLMLLTAVLIKLTSPGPVFFKQPRVGFMGKVFTMYKFRTMEVETDCGIHRDYVTDLVGNGRPMVKIDNRQRLIPFGKIIRRLFIDELPQLFNVIRGQMSLVGPRPAILYEVQAYHDWHMKRLLAIPGMTGLWQVSGKNRLTFDEMVRLDIRYAHECSFLMDVKIILKTPLAIVSEVRNKQNH
jgi:lipopolysaccharide/colanic/teichoic acid biosynthesis glycosyltransferase